ncbi:MAG TPA: redoxin domain-containing protein [Chitinophagaceae bacterium]|nr:redoxin domain-containing protein [Chitinophagaceae bacterium]
MKSIWKSLVLFAAISFSIVSVAQEQQPMLGQPAPSFALKAIDGKTYSLEQLRGKYLVIHFAATWCPFCNAEAPYLQELSKNYRDKGVEVFIVDVKEDKALVEKSFARFNFSFPVLLDEDGAISTKYAPEGVQPDLARHEVPLASNLIIDKQGKIRFYSLLNTTTFDAKLTKLKEKLDSLLNSK